MATDATGTPTANFGIPKIDPTNDAPSGLGMNAMMDSIDGLFGQAPMSSKITGIAVGSVPVWNGSAWVKPTGTPDGTKFLRDDGTWQSVSSLTTGYGTSLPGSPTDGQEYVLVDSTSAPTYQWRFRYNAGSGSSYKWEFVGGSPKVVSSDAASTMSSDSFADTATVLSTTVPLDGDWDITVMGRIQITSGASTGTPGFSYSVGGTAAADEWAATAAAQSSYSGERTYRWTGLTAGTTVTHKSRKYVGTNGNALSRRLLFLPVRVS